MYKAISVYSGINLKRVALSIVFLKLMFTLYFIFLLYREYELGNLEFDASFFNYLLVGFIAQIIDGSLGMAYGISCSSLLINFGIPASVASAGVHTAEVFTTGVSGLSHIRLRNLYKKLFIKLTISGIIGAVLGAYFIADVIDGNLLRPYVSIYLLIMGLYILTKAFRKVYPNKKLKNIEILAFFGGLFDAIGGGGWGPIVTSNLISKGYNPGKIIGTINTAEFFITFFSTVTFIFVMGLSHWQVILGLIVGGVLAAPAGAYIAAKANKKVLLVTVGLLIILLSILNLSKYV